MDSSRASPLSNRFHVSNPEPPFSVWKSIWLVASCVLSAPRRPCERQDGLLLITSSVPRRTAPQYRSQEDRTMLNPHIFRAYDVRGLVGPTSTPTSSARSGAPTRTLIRRQRRTADRRRPGQPRLVGRPQGRLRRGRAGGRRRRRRHRPVTTPILYFATAHWKLDGGANITGSHNPVEYNGVKMVHPGAAPLSEDEIQGCAADRARRLRERRRRLTARNPARRLLRHHRRHDPSRPRRSRSSSTPATASPASTRPSCCAGSAARSSSCTASPTGASPTTCPTRRTPRTSSTSRPR